MTRVGLGWDAHAFDATRPLVLGGVTIPESPGLAGHSDADVVSHAIADALLGACGLGDLGEMFPATDQWRDASSIDILTRAMDAAGRGGWSIINVDVSVIAETPRLSPHRRAMTEAVAGALGIPASDISIKATTTDRMGFIGRSEGIAALAVILIEKP